MAPCCRRRCETATLSGSRERQLGVGLHETFSDPLLGVDAVPEAEIAALAGSSPSAASAVLALYRAWRPRGRWRHRAAVRAARPAAQRRGARLFRRPRQPFPE